jgi:hypothetical protein
MIIKPIYLIRGLRETLTAKNPFWISNNWSNKSTSINNLWDNFCFYLQNRLIQTSQTGGQWYSDTSPFSIPWPNYSGKLSCPHKKF